MEVGTNWIGKLPRRRLALTVALVAGSALAAQEPRAPAADSPRDSMPAAHDVTRANQLLGTIMSPFCPGLTLANCPSVYAETLRVSIRARLATGESSDSIMESLVAAFGEGVRGAPRARGLGLALWALPLVGLGAGAIGLVWWLRNRSVGADLGPAGDGGSALPRSITQEDRARLEAVLRQYQ